MKIRFYSDPTTGRVTEQVSVPDSDTGGIYAPDLVIGDCYVSGTDIVKVPEMPPGQYAFDWVSKVWVPDIPAVRRAAKEIVNVAAGVARKRYRNFEPGQGRTDLRKEEQARAWAASSYSGSAPSYIAAEATARSMDPVDVADEAIADADDWDSNKGPEIEATRAKWCEVIDEEEADANLIMFRASQGKDELDGL